MQTDILVTDIEPQVNQFINNFCVVYVCVFLKQVDTSSITAG